MLLVHIHIAQKSVSEEAIPQNSSEYNKPFFSEHRLQLCKQKPRTNVNTEYNLHIQTALDT